jgi:hypothetical protein
MAGGWTNSGGGGWLSPDAEVRREKLRKSMMGNSFSTGRPKGSKNKKPYPKSDAVMKRLADAKQFLDWTGKKHKESTKEIMSEKRSLHIEKYGLQMSYKGKFSPKNPSKYTGDVSNIVFRSLWERTFFQWCDTTDSIVEWSSEEVIIPYISPLDRKYHRYFPDVFLVAKQSDGSLKKQLVEIKPLIETLEPKRPDGKRTSKKYIRSVTKYLVNKAKWDAAREVCATKQWDFVIITEKQLYPKQHK